jgi:hypothetical protein
MKTLRITIELDDDGKMSLKPHNISVFLDDSEIMRGYASGTEVLADGSRDFIHDSMVAEDGPPNQAGLELFGLLDGMVEKLYESRSFLAFCVDSDELDEDSEEA